MATLPLINFLKVNPDMWLQVLHMLHQKGYEIHKDWKNLPLPSHTSESIKKVPLNKVNKYEKPGRDKGNAMLPIKMNGVKTLAILDTGAGISIITKALWIKWREQALRKTRLELQLADGNLERPIGLLEDILVESCGIQYEQTFAVVDFGQDPN